MRRIRQSGFSLVELMVALTLSLILVAGALSVLYTSRLTYFQNERTGRLQESGRVAVELMLRDMRASGFRGCTQYVPKVVNKLPTPTGLLWNFGVPVQGFEATGKDTWSPTLDASIINTPVSGNDIIAVRTTLADSPAYMLNTAMTSSTSDLVVDKLASDKTVLPGGTTLMISDCSGSAVFAVSSFDDKGTTATIGTNSVDLEREFGAGAQVTRVDTVVYYISESLASHDGVHNPALWRQVANSDPQELIEGVEALQIRYGIDTDGDRLVNSYVQANAVTNWSNVVSASIGVLIRSLEPNADMPDKRKYTLLADEAQIGPFEDRYQRALYTTTVALRNNTQ
jgi:type IV pilus assembly protein PilW